jgi:SAM-dependent methyltransferase
MNSSRTIHSCPVCGSKNVASFTTIPRLPIFLFPVPREVIGSVTSHDFHLGECQVCSHLFQSVEDPAILGRIYDDLYRHYQLDVSVEFAGVYLDKFRDFFRGHARGNRLLDVGCGEAPLAGFFQELGFSYSGLEPSPKQARATANNPGTDIRRDLLRPGLFKERFDVVLLNFVLEHLFDLRGTLALLQREYLAPGGRVFVTVPNIATYLRDGIQFYAHEHAQYFTPFTLRRAFEANEFAVVADRSLDEPAIWMCAENHSPEPSSDNGLAGDRALKHEFLAQQNGLAEAARRAFADERHIVLYGAGLPAFWLCGTVLAAGPAREIDLLDDNSAYQGRYVAIVDKPICRLEELRHADDPLFVISTSAPYQDRIEAKIRALRPRARVARIRQGHFELRPVPGGALP